jgi:hypothetical protein
MAHSRILQDQLPANRHRRSADALNPAQEKRKAVKLGSIQRIECLCTVDTCRSDAFTCVASAGYGRNSERHFLEPEAYKAVVVPVLKQLDTNSRRRIQNAGRAAKDGIAHDATELIFTNIGGDIYPSSGVCEGKCECSMGGFDHKY